MTTTKKLRSTTKSSELYEAMKDIVPPDCRKFSIIAEVDKFIVLEMELIPKGDTIVQALPNLKQLSFLEDECYNSAVISDEGWP